MQETAPAWGPKVRDTVVGLLYWLTDGFGSSVALGKTGKMTRWFVWHVEYAASRPLWKIVGEELTGREVIQKIGCPTKGGVDFVIGRMEAAYEREGLMWGIGAASDAGQVARLTLGIPADWMADGDPERVTLPGRILWQTDKAICRHLWGCLAGV